MPNSSTNEEPVRRKVLANVEIETADTSVKRNQKNAKSTKQLTKMTSEASGDEVQQISNRNIEKIAQISPQQVDQKSLKGKSLGKSESTK